MSQGYFFLNRVKLNFFKGEIMKFIYTLIGCLLLAACSTSDNSDDQSMSQSPVVEYVWQTKGPFSLPNIFNNRRLRHALII